MIDHTPGPWTIAKHDHGERRDVLGVFAPNATLIVECAWGKNIAESDANTRLIAAAPDLLDAAKIALEYIEGWMEERHYPDTVEEWRIFYGEEMPDAIYAQRDRVRAAIAKAQGTP